MEEKVIVNTQIKEALDGALAIGKELSNDEKLDIASKAREEAEKARIDAFSNQKGKEQNQLYEDYLTGSIKENFNERAKVADEYLKLKQEISKRKIELTELEFNTEISIKKRQVEADIEYEKQCRLWDEKISEKKKQLANLKIKSFDKIFWPILGVVLGIVAYFVLSAIF